MPNNSSDNFHLLVESVRRYISLNKDYARLELVEKLTILLSTFLLITTLIILGTGALFYALFALAYALEPIVGGLSISFLLICVISLLLTFILYLNRTKLIVDPIARFLSKLFLEKEK
jgi:hypothetical protein